MNYSSRSITPPGFAWGLPVLFLITLLATASTFAGQIPAVELEVACSFTSLVPDDDSQGPAAKEQVFLKVRTFLRNVGSAPITVPTSTVQGKPSRISLRSGSLELCYEVGYDKTGIHGMVTPSPLRFFPVVLPPHESTELPAFEIELKDPLSMTRVAVSFVVDQNYALKQGWWYGMLTAEMNPITPVLKQTLRTFYPAGTREEVQSPKDGDTSRNQANPKPEPAAHVAPVAPSRD